MLIIVPCIAWYHYYTYLCVIKTKIRVKGYERREHQGTDAQGYA